MCFGHLDDTYEAMNNILIIQFFKLFIIQILKDTMIARYK